MQEATPASVLGNFDDATFTYGGVTSTFFQRDGKFFVRTDGPDGELADFAIAYTFGVFPLQQYLIPLPDGRIQALSIAWDARPASEGGQRWFHLYEDQEERIDSSDPLHWTGRQQNWNYMCADCHSTDVRRNYDAASDTFATSWSEISVGCEACHGPGSDHVAWANGWTITRDWRWPGMGLTAALDERRGVRWTTDPATGTPARSTPRTTATEIETCAPCHSRRAQIAEGHRAGDPLLDAYVPATLDANLYFPDGQQRDEVYTYGSFLQSRMNHAGVTCSDCHEPHTQALRSPGNTLCTQCHVPAKYDAPSHHHHAAGTAGASCVSCHMPARTYMTIDDRRDHSIRVPRPDQSVALGVPNACTSCHEDESNEWAAARVRDWYGRDAIGFQSFAEAFASFDDEPDATTAVAALAADTGQPPMVRASALARLGTRVPQSGRQAVAGAITSGLNDPAALARRAALSALGVFPPETRLGPAAPLLADPSLGVRIEAARQVAPGSPALPAGARATFDRAAAEYERSERLMADRPENRVALAGFLADTGRAMEAMAEYRAAIRLAPTFAAGYANLAELQRQSGDEAAAEATLREGLAAVPDAAGLHHALGLSLARSRRTDEAVDELRRAADLDPDTARFAYAYAVALHSSGHVDRAIAVVVAARQRHPRDRDLLVAEATFNRDAGRIPAALAAARELVRLFPDDAAARALFAQLDGD